MLKSTLERKSMTTFSVPGSNGRVELDVSLNQPLFIVGRNGTGKSALVHHLYKSGKSGRVSYLPGSRTSLFDGEGLNLTPSARRALTANLTAWDNIPDTRWKNISGNSRNEKALHDLTVSEAQYKADLANAIADKVDVEKNTKTLQSKSSPLDRVNVLLEQANIPVQMALLDGELRARTDGNEYSFARMSDGERTALILIAEVISAKDGVIFIIDEPELHLHRSIVVPLIASLIQARPACEFIVSTHELGLPTSVPKARVCLVRSAKWNKAGAIESWDVDIINDADKLPEDLRSDILGSRGRVLFTEGAHQSLDIPMYSILFPGVSVRPKGGCREVHRAVIGIRSTSDLHHTEGFGLVDNDGMSAGQIAKYQAESIFPLPVFSVESLYYDADVMAAVAERQAATMATADEDQKALAATFVADAISSVITAAGQVGTPEHLAGRLAERRVNDELIAKFPKRDELANATSQDITITSASPYPAELARYQGLLAAKDVYGLIARYPVRHSGILKAVAAALRFQNREDYEAAALTRVSADEDLRNKLRAKLEPLASALTT
jgi:predicted ATPase